MKAFDEPIYITRPLLPDLNLVQEKLATIWAAKFLTNGGPQHQQLEKKLVETLRVPYLSLFNNGTNALLTASQSLRLSGEVITTPFTFAATPHSLVWNNITPVFADIDPVTMNLDPSKIEALITNRTTGILGVHVYGTPCDVQGIQKVADKYGLKVMYDAAHAFGVTINGVGIGNFGDMVMLSFHATKLYHTVEGGALMYRDPNLKQRIEQLKNFGIKNEEEVIMPGLNGKMNEVQAAIGLVVLDCVEEERRKRAIIAATYDEMFGKAEGISFLPQLSGVTPNYQYYVIRVDEAVFGCSRDYIYNELKKYNVFARKYFYPLCSDYACYRMLPSSNPANLPVAQKASHEVLSMPFYGTLTLEEAEQISRMVLAIRDKAIKERL